MNKYGLFGKLTAKEGKIDELLEILLQASETMRAVKGCRLYVVSRDDVDKNSIRVFEVWDTKVDHDNSLNDPKARELIQKAVPLLAEMPEQGVELGVAGGV